MPPRRLRRPGRVATATPDRVHGAATTELNGEIHETENWGVGSSVRRRRPLARPATAGAHTKTIYAGEPPAATKVISKLRRGRQRVLLEPGDDQHWGRGQVRHHRLPHGRPARRSGKDLPLILAGSTITGVNDAAGKPFWFNGKLPSLSLNPSVVIPQPGTTYDGTKRILDPAPALGPPKPVKVTFTKTGTYKYFCDIHTGMVGYVVVKAAGKPIPSAKQDKSHWPRR